MGTTRHRWSELTGYDREEGRGVHRGWYLKDGETLWIVKPGVGGYGLGFVFMVRHEGQVTVPVAKYSSLEEAQESPWLEGDRRVLTSFGTVKKVRGGATMERLLETTWTGLFEGEPDAPAA